MVNKSYFSSLDSEKESFIFFFFLVHLKNEKKALANTFLFLRHLKLNNQPIYSPFHFNDNNYYSYNMEKYKMRFIFRNYIDRHYEILKKGLTYYQQCSSEYKELYEQLSLFDISHNPDEALERSCYLGKEDFINCAVCRFQYCSNYKFTDSLLSSNLLLRKKPYKSF